MKFSTLILMLLLVTPSSADPGKCARADLEQWFGAALQAVDAVQPGMTRAELLRTFEPEDGFSSRGRVKGTFVYRGCGYVKLDVEFSPSEDSKGGPPNPRDVITSVSRPYLARPVYD
jgi:hypothetical protein